MKLKLNSYYQSFQDKVVKCVTHCVIEDCEELVYFPKFRDCDMTIEALPNGTIIQSFEVSALAKCDPQDSFDYVKGKRIAESRACIKAFKIVDGLIEKSREMLTKTDNLLIKAYNRNGYNLAKEEAHLNILLGNE